MRRVGLLLLLYCPLPLASAAAPEWIAPPLPKPAAHPAHVSAPPPHGAAPPSPPPRPTGHPADRPPRASSTSLRFVRSGRPCRGYRSRRGLPLGVVEAGNRLCLPPATLDQGPRSGRQAR